MGIRVEDVKKKTIFYCPGPEYLFYDTGINCLWELSLAYLVILLLDFPYSDINKLEQLKKKGILQDYIYAYYNPNTSLKVLRMIQRHQYYCQSSKYYFTKYKPAAILQHSDYNSLNLYWFREACTNNCIRIKIVGSHCTDEPEKDTGTIYKIHIGEKQKKYNIPYWLAYLLNNTINIMVYYSEFYIVPILLTMRFFKPNIRPFPIKNKWYSKKVRYFEYSLVFSEQVRNAFEIECGEPAKTITNPLYTVGENVHAFLFGKIEQKDEILILPTDSEAILFKQEQRISDNQIAEHFFTKWSKAINILQNKFPFYKISIKLKPSRFQDSLMKLITKRLAENIAGISILPSDENTQRLILRAKVIVSTYSSVLWWANHLKSIKTLISLDLFDTPDGALFAKTKGIHYFNSIDALEKFDFSQTSLPCKIIEHGITLTQFMDEKIKCMKIESIMPSLK